MPLSETNEENGGDIESDLEMVLRFFKRMEKKAFSFGRHFLSFCVFENKNSL